MEDEVISIILKCLGSSSAGNCYMLDSGKEVLILDCGIDMQKIKIALNFDISKVAGVCVTHQHLDHAKSVKDFENMGISVFKPYEFANAVSAECNYMGNFKIKSFALTDKNGKFMHTNNDGSECPCYGFLIENPDMGRMLYITDTELIKWKFRDINHILIGVNYDKDLIPPDHPAREHIFRGHLELQTVVDFIKANKSYALRSVILCHLSAENADPDKMVAEVQNAAGNSVYVDVARPGFEVELNLYPF